MYSMFCVSVKLLSLAHSDLGRIRNYSMIRSSGVSGCRSSLALFGTAHYGMNSVKRSRSICHHRCLVFSPIHSQCSCIQLLNTPLMCRLNSLCKPPNRSYRVTRQLFFCCFFSITVTYVTFIPKHLHKRAAMSALAASLKQNSLTPEPSPFSQFAGLVYCKGIEMQWACDKENKC